MSALFGSRFGSMMLAVGMFLILGVMMIPMPTGLMDLALTFNIAFGLTVLLVTLYTKEPLEFSVFPSLLLVLTLLRLALQQNFEKAEMRPGVFRNWKMAFIASAILNLCPKCLKNRPLASDN